MVERFGKAGGQHEHHTEDRILGGLLQTHSVFVSETFNQRILPKKKEFFGQRVCVTKGSF